MDRHGEDSHGGEHAEEHAIVEYGGAAYAEGGHNWTADDSMGSSSDGNGGPLVTFPDDKIGSTVERPNQAFFINAPQFNWTVVGSQDEVARQGLAQLANEVFRFGQMVEGHHFYLRDQVADAEVKISQHEKDVKEVRDQVTLLKRRLDQDSEFLHQSQEAHRGKKSIPHRGLRQRFY